MSRPKFRRFDVSVTKIEKVMSLRKSLTANDLSKTAILDATFRRFFRDFRPSIFCKKKCRNVTKNDLSPIFPAYKR